MTAAQAPGQGSLGPAVERFDQRADELLEVVRGNPIIDGVFTTASRVGDFSLIWHVVSVTRGVRTRRPDQVVALAVALGAESLIVNQGIKRIFRRARPTTSGRRAIPRAPTQHVRVPQRTRQLGGLRGDDSQCLEPTTNPPAVVDARRDRRDEPCLRAHSSRLRRDRRCGRRCRPRSDRRTHPPPVGNELTARLVE